MISENLQELLSAYVDGELDSNEYERVMATLRDSEAARKYVADLRSVSQQLKSLPGLTYPKKLTQQFLQKQKLARSYSLQRTIGSAVAIAAGMLVAVGVWWYLSKPDEISQVPVPTPAVNVAKNHDTRVIKSPNPLVEPKRSFDLAPYLTLAQQALAQAFDEIESTSQRFHETINWLAVAESIREGKQLDHQAHVLASPVKNMGSYFKTLERPLPVLFSISDFSQDKLKSHIQLKETFVLDLSSQDSIKSMRRLLEAGKQAQLPIEIDDELQHRLSKNLPATFMIYLENLTEAQLTALMNALETTDYWKHAELKNSSTISSMLLYPLDAPGRNQVAKSLGLDQNKLVPSQAGQQFHGVALTYFSYRLPQSLSAEVRKTTTMLTGTAPDRLSLVVMVRSAK